MQHRHEMSKHYRDRAQERRKQENTQIDMVDSEEAEEAEEGEQQETEEAQETIKGLDMD